MRIVSLIVSVALVATWVHTVTDHHDYGSAARHAHHEHDDHETTSPKDSADSPLSHGFEGSSNHHEHDGHTHSLLATPRNQEVRKVSEIISTPVPSPTRALIDFRPQALLTVRDLKSRSPLISAGLLTTVLRR